VRRLRDRVAVVTGAASGIGRATGEALARRGCDVALVDLDEGGLAESAARVRGAGRKASLHRVDVSDRAAMEALPEAVLAEHGHVHVVVNNAGVSVGAELSEHSLDDFEWLMGINFWGVVYGCKLFLPHLLREEEGHIVNVSSMFGFIGFPGQISYCASKFAVRGLSESLHAELAGTRVGVTSVHPGAIRTNIVAGARMAHEEERQRALDLFARRGRPPEYAAERIVRGIERGKLRVLVTPEAFATDWIKRLLPVGTHRMLAWAHSRGRAREAEAGR
jgi:NAD(P)-dependent dehydrogenase (short-subunit alcohol dehydrogenase family)